MENENNSPVENHLLDMRAVSILQLMAILNIIGGFLMMFFFVYVYFTSGNLVYLIASVVFLIEGITLWALFTVIVDIAMIVNHPQKSQTT